MSKELSETSASHSPGVKAWQAESNFEDRWFCGHFGYSAKPEMCWVCAMRELRRERNRLRAELTADDGTGHCWGCGTPPDRPNAGFCDVCDAVALLLMGRGTQEPAPQATPKESAPSRGRGVA